MCTPLKQAIMFPWLTFESDSILMPNFKSDRSYKYVLK